MGDEFSTDGVCEGHAVGGEEPVLNGVCLPDGAPLAVRVQLTLEDWGQPPLLADAAGRPTDIVDYRELSIRMYGLRTGIHRLLETMDEIDARASVTTCGIVGDRWPDIVADIAARGHEIVGHGYDQNDHAAFMDADEDLATVRRTVEALERAGGYRPVGWAGAGSRRGPYTVESLLRSGFIYTNDFREADVPFVVARMGERRLIAMPRSDEINDNYAVHNFGQSPGNFVEYFRRSFDRLLFESERNPGRVVTAICHSTIMGHPWGADAIAECVEYGRRNGAWIATSRQIAEHYLDALPAVSA